MGVISHILNQTCSIVTSTVNRYGDYVMSSQTQYPCRFREITSLDRNINREDLDADAMIWLEPTVPVEEGTIILYDGEYYRVEEITKARRFSEDVVFQKCLLEKHGEVLTS